MSYDAGEALVLTQLQNVTGFSSTNTSRGKFKLLNSGNSDHYGIVMPGETKIDPAGFGIFGNGYDTVIQVWQRYKDDGTSLTNLEALIGPIKTRFQQYRKLADTTDTIVDSAVKAVSPVEEMWKQGADGPSWLRMKVTVHWIEQEKITYAE